MTEKINTSTRTSLTQRPYILNDLYSGVTLRYMSNKKNITVWFAETVPAFVACTDTVRLSSSDTAEADATGLL